ncbi:MAG: hypothetical protein ACXWDM_11675 [Nocardioides sp.]
MDEPMPLSLRHHVYRGQVVSFGHSMFGERGSVSSPAPRPWS